MRAMTVSTSVLIALLGHNQVARAESYLPWQEAPRVVEDRLRLDFGVFAAGFDTTARVDAGTEFPGTEFNAEQDFGLSSSKNMPLIELTLLPGERHLIRFNSLSIRRSAIKEVAREIDYDIDTFEPGDVVNSTLNFELLGIGYGYRFVRSDRFEADALLGIQLVDITFNAHVPGQTVREATGDISPVPLVGLEARIDLSSRWSLEARAQYMSINYDEVSGSLSDFQVATTWRMNAHLALGAGYKHFTMTAESQNEDSAGLATLHAHGPMMFVRAGL